MMTLSCFGRVEPTFSLSRLPYSRTIGKDVTGDRYPDIPLRLTFEDSDSYIQFPLGFCPGNRRNLSDPQVFFQCRGEWAFVLKEWITPTRMYPDTAKNINIVSKQIDIDVYDEQQRKVDISDFKDKFVYFIIERTAVRGPYEVGFKSVLVVILKQRRFFNDLLSSQRARD